MRPVTNLAARVGKSVPETVRVEDRARLVFSSGISGLGQVRINIVCLISFSLKSRELTGSRVKRLEG